MGSAALKNLGDKIRLLREKKGLKQGALAEDIGIQRTYLSGVENGKHDVSFTVLLKIAEALEVSLDDLYPRVLVVEAVQRRTLPGISFSMLADKIRVARIGQIRQDQWDKVRAALLHVLPFWWWDLHGKVLTSSEIAQHCRESPSFRKGSGVTAKDNNLRIAIGMILDSIREAPLGDIEILKTKSYGATKYEMRPRSGE